MKLFIIRTPDWNGGWGFRAEWSEDPELDDFEYIEGEYAKDELESHLDDLYEGHVEPFHENPYDFTISVREILNA